MTTTSSVPLTREWSWDAPHEAYAPRYTAMATPGGISYMVTILGPHGGPGMAGSQSYEDLLANGPINSMPADIESDVRVHAETVVRDRARALLRWELTVDPAGAPATEQLAYVSAVINEMTTVSKVTEEDTVVLFDGSVVAGTARLALAVGFGRPWRRTGSRTVHYQIDVSIPAGATTTVQLVVRPDFTVVRRT